MALDILRDSNIIGRIERERESSPRKPYIQMLLDRFRGYHVQELGGSVRSAVIAEWHGTPFSLEDWDLIVDDSKSGVDLFDLCRGLPGQVGMNYFGNVQWKVDGYKFDVTKYSSERSEDGCASLENFFRGVDFSIGAIAYCMEHGEILSLGALEAIRDRKIDLVRPSSSRPQATIVRALNFERRLGFELDNTTVDYIRRTYTPELDSAIANYIAYKEMAPEVHSYCIKRLGEIVQVRKFS